MKTTTTTKHGLRYVCESLEAVGGKNMFLWENGIIPVEIPDDCKKVVIEGIKFFTDQPKLNKILTFQIKTPEDKNWVKFIPNSPLCTSEMIGRRKDPGPQEITLTRDATAPEVAHEIMHALGFFHEHQRVDRSGHIVVEGGLETVSPLLYHNFKIVGEDEGAERLTAYDFQSILHYQDGLFVDQKTEVELKVPPGVIIVSCLFFHVLLFSITHFQKKSITASIERTHRTQSKRCRRNSQSLFKGPLWISYCEGFRESDFFICSDDERFDFFSQTVLKSHSSTKPK